MQFLHHTLIDIKLELSLNIGYLFRMIMAIDLAMSEDINHDLLHLLVLL